MTPKEIAAIIMKTLNQTTELRQINTIVSNFLAKKLEDHTSTSEEELESKRDSESYDDSSELSPEACFEWWHENIKKLEAFRALNATNTPSTLRSTKIPRLRSLSACVGSASSTPQTTNKSVGSELLSVDITKASSAAH